MGCLPGKVWKVLSLLEALGSKFPTQKHQTHLERGSRTQGWVCTCWDQEQLILTPDPDPALAHLLRLHDPTSLSTQGPGEGHKSAIPTFMSSYFTELQEEKLTHSFPHRNNNTWGLLCGSKRKNTSRQFKTEAELWVQAWNTPHTGRTLQFPALGCVWSEGRAFS